MTRAPTYPIHRNRRNSISIRFSVRSIRFSRCGLRACRPSPSRLARARRQGDTLPPSRGRVKGEFPLHRASTTRGGGLREEKGALRDGQGAGGRREKGPPPCRGGPRCGGAGPCAGWGACMHARIRGRSPRKRRKAPGLDRGQEEGPPEGGPFGARKRPARARLPILPQPGAAVLSATAGLTAEFGTGSGDPRLHGLARAGR